MSGWLQTVVEVLTHDGEEACLGLLVAVHPAVGQRLVELVDGPVSAVEALRYAAILFELGQTGSAMEILGALASPAALMS